MTEQALSVRERVEQSIALRHELAVEDLLAQVQKIQQVMHQVMKKDEHFGLIPGTGKKLTLFKAGAEKLCLLFRLDPQYEIVSAYDGRHLTVVSTCTLYHIPTGQRWGSGMGSCSTKESKYAYRQAKRVCPTCGKEAIIKGKAEYGGGWLCFKKQDGCGAKFDESDPAITGQEVGRVANEDVADQYNTALKMANKRALVAGVLNVTAASDIFTQDLEDTAREDDNPIRVADVIDTTPPPQRSHARRPQREIKYPTPAPPYEPPGDELLPNEAREQADGPPSREALLMEITQVANVMKLTAASRQAWWREVAGDANPQTVDVALLSDLLAKLREKAANDAELHAANGR